MFHSEEISWDVECTFLKWKMVSCDWNVLCAQGVVMENHSLEVHFSALKLYAPSLPCHTHCWTGAAWRSCHAIWQVGWDWHPKLSQIIPQLSLICKGEDVAWEGGKERKTEKCEKGANRRWSSQGYVREQLHCARSRRGGKISVHQSSQTEIEAFVNIKELMTYCYLESLLR